MTNEFVPSAPVPSSTGPSSTVPSSTGPSTPAGALQPGVEMILSEERVNVATRRVPTEVVRIVKHIVTEEVTRTFSVRREELRVERAPYTGLDEGTAGRTSAAGPIEIVLHAEEVELVPRVVAREVARVYVDRLTEHEIVHTDLAREELEIDTAEVDAGLPGRA